MSDETASHVRYIDKTRAYYRAEGYAKPYEWAHFDDIPFTPFASVGKPLSRCRVGVVTTSEMARRDVEAGPDDPEAARVRPADRPPRRAALQPQGGLRSLRHHPRRRGQLSPL